MKPAKLITYDQAKLIQELGIDPETVSFMNKSADLPCQITIWSAGKNPQAHWVRRDKASSFAASS